MAVTEIKHEKGRYTGLIISIVLLLSLIGGLLAFTFYTSNLIERNTVLISETNHVANDALSVSTDLFDLANSYGEDTKSDHIQRVLDRLQDRSQDIASSLVAIAHGGEVIGDTGKTYDLPTITDEETLRHIRIAQTEWSSFQPLINSYLRDARNVKVDSLDDLSAALNQAKTSSLIINQSLDALTVDVFVESQRQTELIRLIQVIGVIAILVYFIIFVFFFLRRLRQSDEETLEARRETQEIMQTVSTGLFLLDNELNIGKQHSKALESIIGTHNLAGENFADILRGRISDKDLTTTRQFIEQLYNPRVKERLVNDLNPLQKVMLHNASSEQTGANRYLDFKFSRVYEGKKIARILVNVMDVSEAVKLEKRLEQEREQNDMQIEMLTTILNVEPKLINEFIANTKAHISKINNILKNPGSSQFELEAKLNSIYREMHSLKGESSALKLHSFTKIASEAEDKLYAMQNQGKLSGNDFLPLAVDLDELLNLSNTIETLGERINQGLAKPVALADSSDNGIAMDTSDATITVAPTHSSSIVSAAKGPINNINEPTVNSMSEFYQDFATEIASRQGKSVALTTQGLSTGAIPTTMSAAVKEIVIQLLRNAIVHGIETPGQRLASNKSESGQIALSFERTSEALRVSITDDGRGIDYDRIRQIIVEKGLFDSKTAANLSKDDLLAQLFSSGFSTRSHADEDGGRGVGLDIIKDRVEGLNGDIVVDSEKGKMTHFMITVPTP